jgi:hypothetical protein
MRLDTPIIKYSKDCLTPKIDLTGDQIERLEEIGFKWKLNNVQGLSLTMVGCDMTTMKRVFSDDPKLC